MPVFDVWDSAANTELVRRNIQNGLESSPRVGARIAPLVNTSQNRVKRTIIERKALGAAQIVARYAAPAIYTPEISYTQEWIELVKMDEMSPIEEDEWDKLVNGTDYEKNVVGADPLSRARDMQIRYETRTEIMRWAAFQDDLAFQLAEGGATPPTIEVKFDMPDDNKPDGSDWNDRDNSTPITDLETFQEIPFTASSVWALDLYMSNHTYKNLKYSKQVSDLLSDDANTFKIPTKTQVESLLIGGSFNAENQGNPQGTNIIITDASYRPESAGYDRGAGSVTRFLPDDYVLGVVRGQVDGENVAEVLNGRVAIRQSESSPPQWVQGPANHTWAKMDPPYTHYARQVCKRIPRVNRPECIVWAFVGRPDALMTEFMVADGVIVFGTVRGPGATLRPGEKIEVEKVNPAYLERVRAGRYKAHIEGEPDGDSKDDGGGSDVFDPADKVDDVIAYLDGLEGDGVDEEIERVKSAERSIEGKPHRPNDRVLNYEKKEG